MVIFVLQRTASVQRIIMHDAAIAWLIKPFVWQRSRDLAVVNSFNFKACAEILIKCVRKREKVIFCLRRASFKPWIDIKHLKHLIIISIFLSPIICNKCSYIHCVFVVIAIMYARKSKIFVDLTA